MTINRRTLPINVPATREQLRVLGIKDKQLYSSFVHVTRTTWIPKEERETPPELDIITRARGHHLERPHLPLTSWAALAYYGLKYWADAAPVAFISNKRARKSVRSTLGPHFQFKAELPSDCSSPDPKFPELRCVSIEEALVSALKDVREEAVSWFVPNVDGWSYVDIRAVQLVDAVRRISANQLSWPKIQKLARRRIESRWLTRIAHASDGGSDSPMETVLRLIVTGISVDASPLRWESQVPIYPDASTERPNDSEFVQWKTVSDLLCREFRIVLFYDGGHHSTAKHLRHDAEVNAFLQAHGFKVLRVTRNMLDEPEKLKARIMLLVLEARKEKLQRETA